VNAPIVREFPAPTNLLISAFAELQIARSDDEGARRTLGDISALARPWDPPTCPPTLRDALWIWLDRVVAWINHEYTWRHDQVIPACWPAHPHVVHEVAVIACLRYAAGHALTADALEDWHRYALPAFFDRISARFGGAPCQPGEHKKWPSAARYTDYESDSAVRKRIDRYALDTDRRPCAHPPPPPSRTGRAGRTALSAVRPSDQPNGDER
jgi:hypothetical protein